MTPEQASNAIGSLVVELDAITLKGAQAVAELAVSDVTAEWPEKTGTSGAAWRAEDGIVTNDVWYASDVRDGLAFELLDAAAIRHERVMESVTSAEVTRLLEGK